MSFLISAYSKTAFEEYLLPAEENVDVSLIFYGDVFDLPVDEAVRLENIDGGWYFVDSEDCKVLLDRQPYAHQAVAKGDIVDVRFKNGTFVSMIVRGTERALQPFRLFDVTDLKEITFGSSRENDVVVRMLGLISHRHLILHFEKGTCAAEDVSRNGTFINRRKAGKMTMLQAGDRVNLYGVRVIWLGGILAIDPDERAAEVLSPELLAREFVPGREGFQTGSGREPVLHHAGYRPPEKIHRRAPRMADTYPSAEECSRYDNHSIGLWNRNVRQRDFLFARIGTASTSDNKKPVGVNLRKSLILGILSRGSRVEALRLAQILLIQVAANHSPSDVKIAVIYNRENGLERKMLGPAVNLPHVWTDDRKIRLVADGRTSAVEVFYELAKRVRRRAERGEDGRGTRYVLLLTDRDLLEGQPLAKYILDPKTEYGLSTIFPADAEEDLPNECDTIVESDSRFQGIYSVSEAGEQIGIRFDELPDGAFGAFAGSLADIRVKETKENLIVPEQASFLDLYGVSSAAELDIENRWRKNRTYDSLAARVGLRGTDRPVYLDINEKFHGPHGLVAGMTGSGKSEFLVTYLLSLAVEFGPEDVNFLLIDYKGGGMANLMSDLPHVAGSITNLSGNDTRRALLAIKSEIVRRQRIFGASGVNHIDRYTKMYKNHLVNEAVPHLVIVVDEFAELKKEQPDFLTELVSVAQIGRSLGVHLILATQRPAGCVDDQIRSNSRFRICLRVQDRQDSADMLGHPDAAFLVEVGRAYFQVGQDEIYEEFQTGWSGDRDGSGQKTSSRKVCMTTITGKPFLVEEQGSAGGDGSFAAGRITQLTAVKERIRQTAAKGNTGSARTLWLPPLPKRIDLEDCPDVKTGTLQAVVGLADDPEEQKQSAAEIDLLRDGHLAVFGTTACGKSTFLASLAMSLMRGTKPGGMSLFLLDFGGGMLEAFSGAPCVGGYMTAEDPERIRHLFRRIDRMITERRRMLQGGNFAQYIKRNERNAASEAFDEEQDMSAVILMIDQYAAFREQTENAYYNTVVHILREGMSCGIYLVLTASGYGNNGVGRTLADYIRQVVCLEMKDKYAYTEAFRVLNIPVLPEEGISGRGLIRTGRKILEFQTACPVPGEDGYEQMERIRKFCAQTENPVENPAPEGAEGSSGDDFGKKTWVPVSGLLVEIPEKPRLKDFLEDPRVVKLLERQRLPLAYREEDASIFEIDLEKVYSFLLAGPRGSGNKEFLANVMETVSRAFAGPGESGFAGIYFGRDDSLSKAADRYGFSRAASPEKAKSALEVLIPTLKERVRTRRNLLLSGTEEDVKREMKAYKKLFFILEDLSSFVNTVTDPEKTARDLALFLENMTERGRDLGIHFISAVDPFGQAASGRKIFETLTRDGQGLLFGGTADAQRLLRFDSLSYAVRGTEVAKGTALISDGAEDTVGGSVKIPGAEL